MSKKVNYAHQDYAHAIWGKGGLYGGNSKQTKNTAGAKQTSLASRGKLNSYTAIGLLPEQERASKVRKTEAKRESLQNFNDKKAPANLARPTAQSKRQLTNQRQSQQAKDKRNAQTVANLLRSGTGATDTSSSKTKGGNKKTNSTPTPAPNRQRSHQHNQRGHSASNTTSTTNHTNKQGGRNKNTKQADNRTTQVPKISESASDSPLKDTRPIYTQVGKDDGANAAFVAQKRAEGGYRFNPASGKFEPLNTQSTAIAIPAVSAFTNPSTSPFATQSEPNPISGALVQPLSHQNLSQRYGWGLADNAYDGFGSATDGNIPKVSNFINSSLDSYVRQSPTLAKVNLTSLREGYANKLGQGYYDVPQRREFSPTQMTVGRVSDFLSNTGHRVGDYLKGVGHGIKNVWNGLTGKEKFDLAVGALQQYANYKDNKRMMTMYNNSLNHTMEHNNREYEMARKQYNRGLEDYQGLRNAYWQANQTANGVAPMATDDYLTKYGA